MVKAFREGYILDICRLLEDSIFIRTNTVDEAINGFSRNRKLTFINLVILITQGLSRSIQRELNSFYQKIKDTDFSIQEVTKSAFTHARKKLKWEAFVELNKEGIASFYKNAPYLKWRGYRLLGIDSSTLLLPNHSTIIEEFGSTQVGHGGLVKRSMARASILYDLLNYITLDAKLASYGRSEVRMAIDHLDSIKAGTDILIMDRGYAGIPLLCDLKKRGIHFVVRLKTNWVEVKKVLQSGERDKIVNFELSNRDQFLVPSTYITGTDHIDCRLIVIDLPDGTKEVLGTSLLDNNEIPYDAFASLYHLRWNIEEGFKLYKSRLNMESFSGKTAHAIKQDFYSKVFMMTTMAVLAFPIEEKLKQEQLQNKKKHSYKINRTNALALTKEISPFLFIKKKFRNAMQAFDKIIGATLEIIRPNRKNPRKKHPKKPPSMNYKLL